MRFEQTAFFNNQHEPDPHRSYSSKGPIIGAIAGGAIVGWFERCRHRYPNQIAAYSTWAQPIFLNPTTLDVVGLSHEISETYNDPFVAAAGLVAGLPTTDTTPWWLSPNGNCQNNLEVGDVIEGLPHQVFPITMPNGFNYHPQVEALLQWFEFQSPSTGPLKPGCVAP